jgi:hypothetical protein
MSTTTLPALDGLAQWLREEAPRKYPSMPTRLLRWADAVESLEAALAVPAQQGVEQVPRWHELKTDPEVFDAVASGAKTFEIRRDDRDFKVGDGLLLRRTRYTGAQMHMRPEHCPLEYTGETERRIVSHILSGYGLEDHWVCLSFAAPSASGDALNAAALVNAVAESIYADAERYRFVRGWWFGFREGNLRKALNPGELDAAIDAQITKEKTPATGSGVASGSQDQPKEGE